MTDFRTYDFYYLLFPTFSRIEWEQELLLPNHFSSVETDREGDTLTHVWILSQKCAMFITIIYLHVSVPRACKLSQKKQAIRKDTLNTSMYLYPSCTVALKIYNYFPLVACGRPLYLSPFTPYISPSATLQLCHVEIFPLLIRGFLISSSMVFPALRTMQLYFNKFSFGLPYFLADLWH